MYRRVNSGRFIGLTTFLIVIVMAVFTWVMYGMAKQVFVMSDIMVELSDSFKSMVELQRVMSADIHTMSGHMGAIRADLAEVNANMGGMTESVESMSASVGSMSTTIAVMSDAVQNMAGNVGRMTYDVSKASYAMSNPMSFMWGNNSPFPF